MSVLLLLGGIFFGFCTLCFLGVTAVLVVELRAEARAERARRERLAELAWRVAHAEPLWTRDETRA